MTVLVLKLFIYLSLNFTRELPKLVLLKFQHIVLYGVVEKITIYVSGKVLGTVWILLFRGIKIYLIN